MSNEKRQSQEMRRTEVQREIWDLALFVTNKDPESLLAFKALSRLCDEHLRGRCKIDIVDVNLHPQLARREGIDAIPTLVKRGPPPKVKLVGDLHDLGRMAVELGLIESNIDG